MASGPYAHRVAADGTLVAAVHSALREVADPARAPAMQAYMKSSMSYLGVPSAVARAALKAVWKAHPLPDRRSWEATVRALWETASHREERYAAIALTGLRDYSAYQDPAALDLYRHLITTGAWWDYVDEIASRRVGPILVAHPTAVGPTMRAWATDGDLWLRRTAIICQLQAKAATDLDLLTTAIEANLDGRDFFIRKAIGWALRQYARIDPDWVRAYVAAHADRLSPLSRREALKQLRADGAGSARIGPGPS
jgi:3-methyladenine DNA glycosylase AlkD